MKRSLLDEFIAFYESFDAKRISELGALYAQDVIFIDPIHRVDGIAALQGYFNHLCAGEGESRFRITDVIRAAESQDGADSSAFLRWQMTYSHPKLAGNKTLTLVGGSMVRYSDVIHHQEDFYDLGQMIYQHLPVLGWAVKKVKSHLAGSGANPAQPEVPASQQGQASAQSSVDNSHREHSGGKRSAL
ncbi:MAG TPA: nuclear transport factor 2 family protein [Marinagarivorans sp.]